MSKFGLIEGFYGKSYDFTSRHELISSMAGTDLNFYLSETIKYKSYFLSIFNYIFSSSFNHISYTSTFSDVPISPGPIFPIILIF